MENAIETNGAGDTERVILAGERAWHGKGLYIPEGARPGDVIMADSEGFGARLVKCQLACPIPAFGAGSVKATDGDGYTASDDWRLWSVGNTTRRMIDGRPVTAAYTPIQPEQWAATLNRLHDECGFTFAGAIMLRGGAQVCYQAKLGQIDLGPLANTRRAKRDTGGRDLVNGFATIGDNRAGERAATCGFATTRAVCVNTVAHAIREARDSGTLYRAIRHVGATDRIDAELREWTEAYRDACAAWQRFGEFAHKAVNTRFGFADFADLTTTIWPDLASVDGKALMARARSKGDTLASLFRSGTGNDGRTVWDAFNAVSEWTNWHATARGAGDLDSAKRWARLDSALYGTGADVMQQAEKLLYAYVSVN